MRNYGIIPKSLMQDKSLSIQAKAVYAYLATYADKNGKCYPSKVRMETELNVAESTLQKYIKELVAKGYLKREQEKSKGKFAHNIYVLCVDKQG